MHPFLLRVISMISWFGILLATIVLAAAFDSISLTSKLRRERAVLDFENPQSALHLDSSYASWKIVLGYLLPVCVSSNSLEVWLLMPSTSTFCL